MNAADKSENYDNDLQKDDGGTGHKPNKSRKEVEREVDKALEDSFPSSAPHRSLSRPLLNLRAIQR
jgi:hypothetical protein